MFTVEDDEDIDHIFEDIDDIYPVAKKPQDGNHPKEEKYAKGESYGKSPSKENKDRLESRITNDNKSASVWDIDFNQAFDETRRKEPKTGISANLDFAVQFDNFDFFAQPGQEKSKDIRQGKFQGQDQGTSSTDPFAAFQNNFGAIENRDDNSKGFIGDNCNRKIQGNSGSNDMKGQVRGEHGNSKENNDLGRDKKEQNVFDFFA